jgi:hypothetical protein
MNTNNKLIVGGVGAILLVLAVYGIANDGFVTFFSRQASSTSPTNNLSGEVKPVSDMGNEVVSQPPVEQPNDSIQSTLYQNTTYQYSFKLPANTVVMKQEEMERGSDSESKSIYVLVGDDRGIVAVAYVGDLDTTQNADDRLEQVRMIAEKKRTEITKDENPNTTFSVGDVAQGVFAGTKGYMFTVREQSKWEFEGKKNTIDQTKNYVFTEHLGKIMMITYSTGTPDIDTLIDSFTFTR